MSDLKYLTAKAAKAAARVKLKKANLTATRIDAEPTEDDQFIPVVYFTEQPDDVSGIEGMKMIVDTGEADTGDEANKATEAPAAPAASEETASSPGIQLQSGRFRQEAACELKAGPTRNGPPKARWRVRGRYQGNLQQEGRRGMGYVVHHDPGAVGSSAQGIRHRDESRDHGRG